MSDASATESLVASGPTGARRALIIANDTYDHASLTQLRAPEADSIALKEVLGDPDIGGFEVTVVRNAASHEVQSHVEDLFADSRPDDLLLLHFSGHGLKSDSGELFIAARNTRPDRLGSTSVSADFVQRCMRAARARTIVLFLDCCYGGAFGQGVAVRAGGPANVMDSFPAGRLGGGRGRAVISASSAMEYAFEGVTLTADHEPQPSLFTSAVVQGLLTGDADRDEDGLVALSELYDYVFDRVREQNPAQTPGRDVEMSGEVYLARSRRRRRQQATPIPEALAVALRVPDPTHRRGAVLELRDLLAGPDLGVALGALEALRAVAEGDIRAVSDDAKAVLAAAGPAVQPAAVDFGDVAADSGVVERRLQVTGGPLARRVRVEAEPPLSVAVEGDVVLVSLTPTGSPYAGSLVVTSDIGSVVVPVTADVKAAEPEAEPVSAPVAGASPGAVLSTTHTAAPADAVPAHDEPAVAPAAFVGGRATAAGATQADAVEPPAGPEPEAPSVEARPGREVDPSKRTAGLRALGAAVMAGAFLVAIGVFLPWESDQSVANPEDSSVAAALLNGLLVVVAGAALVASAVTVEVAAGLAAAVAFSGLVWLPRFFGPNENNDPITPGIGWYLAVIGCVVAVAGCVVAVGLLFRRVAPRRAGQNLKDGATLVALAAAAVSVVTFGRYAQFISEAGSSFEYWARLGFLWTVLAVAVPLLALAVRPRETGRALLGGWAFTALSYSISEWLVIDDRGSSFEGMPMLCLASAVLLATAVFAGRGATAASDLHRR